MAAKWKNVPQTPGENMGFKTTFAKISDIVLHDNEIFRPQKLNIKIKEEDIFSYAKRISGLCLFCAEKFKFSGKGVTKIELMIDI